MSTDRPIGSTARISVIVTEFYDIGRASSRADIELTDTGHGAVSQGRPNDPIVVTAEVHLEFSVAGADGDRYTYSPVGVSFTETRGDGATAAAMERRGGSRDPLGHVAFPVRTFASRGSTIQLSVFDANPEPAEFKFDLLIQRSDGQLGLIDPQIRNNPILK